MRSAQRRVILKIEAKFRLLWPAVKISGWMGEIGEWELSLRAAEPMEYIWWTAAITSSLKSGKNITAAFQGLPRSYVGRPNNRPIRWTLQFHKLLHSTYSEQRSQKDSTINERIAVNMRTAVVICQQGVGCSSLQTDDYTSALTFIPLPPLCYLQPSSIIAVGSD